MASKQTSRTDANGKKTFIQQMLTYNKILAGCISAQAIAYKFASKLEQVAHENKRFSSFEEFYPFYLSQHADVTCQRLHFAGTSIIIALTLLSTGFFKFGTALIPAMFVGCAVGAMTRSLPHGIAEAVCLLATFLVTVRVNSSSWSKAYPALGLMLIGYGFAWVGHFYFEMNKPATFIYPTYSLMGDFRMWFEIATAQRPI